MNLLEFPDDIVTLIEQSKAGVAKADVLAFQKQTRLTNEQLARFLHINVRTWQGYSPEDILKPAVSERVLAVAQLFAKGIEFMGAEKFLHWMRRSNRALGDKIPMELLDTQFGIQLLTDELGRIEHGVLA